MATAAVRGCQAVNFLFRVRSRDQEAMLEVLHEYITSPDPKSEVEDEEPKDLDDLNKESALLETNLSLAGTENYYYYRYYYYC